LSLTLSPLLVKYPQTPTMSFLDIAALSKCYISCAFVGEHMKSCEMNEIICLHDKNSLGICLVEFNKVPGTGVLDLLANDSYTKGI
jgi:hypothetical protein